ncbi:hypothetical protein FUAX_01480 [Fulvitalea axinellae]|uniref:DUF4142 domain-containing protein n=1 Tax=Fulvitalea axinellae TaxID=1182444 RepID=A0AAU9C6Q7_9BACT|nr:hypothetical protein FUAX_01480 [Fulvitalea axinellae]
MKRTAILLFAFALLFSCNNKNKESDKTYDSWKMEMAEIRKDHSEALSILTGFEKKIDTHKERLKEFASYIDGSKKEIATLRAKKKQKEASALEKKIIESADKNMKKHIHFVSFLDNLMAAQGTFEGKKFNLIPVPEDNAVTKFNSLDDAIAFWMKEKNNINTGHDKALSIIMDLKNHIHQHQAEIKAFSEKIANQKGQNVTPELEDNYKENKKKYDEFVPLLKSLKQIQQQFEGK